MLHHVNVGDSVFIVIWALKYNCKNYSVVKGVVKKINRDETMLITTAQFPFLEERRFNRTPDEVFTTEKPPLCNAILHNREVLGQARQRLAHAQYYGAELEEVMTTQFVAFLERKLDIQQQRMARIKQNTQDYKRLHGIAPRNYEVQHNAHIPA